MATNVMCLLGRNSDSFRYEILLPFMLLLSLERMLCLDALLFIGLLTEWDSALLMFLELTAVSLGFLVFPGGLGGTTDWLLVWGYLGFGGYCLADGLTDVYFCGASMVLDDYPVLIGSFGLDLVWLLSTSLLTLGAAFLAGDWASSSKSSSA